MYVNKEIQYAFVDKCQCVSGRSRTCGTTEAEKEVVISGRWVGAACFTHDSNFSLDSWLEYVHVAK